MRIGTKMKKVRVGLLGMFFLFNASVFSQDSLQPSALKIDTSYNYFQFYSAKTAQKFLNHFENVKNDKVVIFHYGASHIQAERPTTFARASLQNEFGNGGRGMIFNYGAADTYSSINYKSTATGVWTFAKSFQGAPKLPLGVCGMTVETKEQNASLNFNFKETIPQENHSIKVFFENFSDCSDFTLKIDSTEYLFDQAMLADKSKHFVEINRNFPIGTITLTVGKNKDSLANFRFYGIDIENAENSGVVYHSLGVGASPMRSVLQLEKLEQQAKFLHPDIVLLDFGTNDILYENAIDPKLKSQTIRAIDQFRALNPDVIIVLTSTQDLYRKGRYISAGPVFRDLMDSIAREKDCLFWNWYDLSGGYQTITTWYNLGYAQKDYIHLTQKGYEVKGEFLASSIKNTLQKIKEESTLAEHTVKSKNYFEQHAQDLAKADSLNTDLFMTGGAIENLPPKAPVVKKAPTKKPIVYKVRSGDTLSGIARKYHSSVAIIKKTNKLSSDRIQVGQMLRIP
ncbi:MAG: LysM peptidoglycan-binding domain-containing protein [Bacteroidota bacterium]